MIREVKKYKRYTSSVFLDNVLDSSKFSIKGNNKNINKKK